MTRSEATGWISARAEEVSTFEGLDWSQLQGVPCEAFGLRSSPCGNSDKWVYQSRPYRLLGYKLNPALRCILQRNAHGLNLIVDQVVLNGLPSMEGWFRADATIRLTPAPTGIHVHQWLELSLSRRGPLVLLAMTAVTSVLERALAESNSRIARALLRRLENALLVDSDRCKPCPI